MTLGFITAAGEGLCRGNLKGVVGSLIEEMKLQRPPQNSFLPVLMAVFPGASGAGQGEQGEQENGTRSVL